MHLRILIADDSPMIRKLVRQCFESQPEWEVCGEAENGKEAIEKAKELSPNVIILDLSMPIMSGLEAAAVLNKLMPAVPIVLFTSFIAKGLEEEAHSAGICKVMAKEGPLSNLIKAVRSVAVRAA
jgi:DNA-binding NarL/FixJ family response regulator